MSRSRRGNSRSFEEPYYQGLEGGIPEAFGRLFTKNLRICVYPLRDGATGKLTTADDVDISGDLLSLHRHLSERDRIVRIDNFDETALHIFSRDVLRRI